MGLELKLIPNIPTYGAEIGINFIFIIAIQNRTTISYNTYIAGMRNKFRIFQRTWLELWLITDFTAFQFWY